MLAALKRLVIPSWLRIAWKLLPWTIGLVFLIGLVLTRGTLHEVRLNDKLVAAQTESAAKAQELKWTQKLSDRQSEYTATLKNLSEVKEKSDEQTKAYAATPAGAASCLAADRVREVIAHRAALEAASTAGGSGSEVRSSPDTK